MLLHVAENIRECLDNAAEARQRAQEAIDPERKAEFLDMERRWICLAESYRLVEHLEAFITDSSLGRRSWPAQASTLNSAAPKSRLFRKSYARYAAAWGK